MSADAFLRRHLGAAGVVGAALAVACAAFYAGGVVPQDARIAELRAELAQAERAGERKGGRRAAAPAAEDRLARFYGYFDSQRDMSAALQAVFDAAEREGVELVTGEYRLARESGARLVRYQIVFPVKGQYPKVRRFVARALHEVPNLALEDITLRRESVGEAAVEARVQLTLYLKQT
jgi:hypothetical protein